MRIEKAVANLLDLSKQSDVTPRRLARICVLTLKKVANSNPAGGEALKLIQSRFLREALSTELNIKRLRRRGDGSNETVSTRVRAPRKASRKRTVAKQSA